MPGPLGAMFLEDMVLFGGEFLHLVSFRKATSLQRPKVTAPRSTAIFRVSLKVPVLPKRNWPYRRYRPLSSRRVLTRINVSVQADRLLAGVLALRLTRIAPVLSSPLAGADLERVEPSNREENISPSIKGGEFLFFAAKRVSASAASANQPWSGAATTAAQTAPAPWHRESRRPRAAGPA